jgi:hypothetical protein
LRPHDNFTEPSTEEDLDELYRRTSPTSSTAASPEVSPRLVTFSKPGLIRVGARTTPFVHSTGGNLVVARLELDVAGAGPTELKAEVNSQEITPNHGASQESPDGALHGRARLEAGSKVSWWSFTGLRLGPDNGSLVWEITEAGDGARGLTVRATFER